MHYSKLSLHNFMCYEDQDIELQPGINVIVGPTDSGKSTLLRALAYTMYNKFPSTVIAREGESETSVTITLDDGNVVSRIRNPKVNAYKVNDQLYTAIGNAVPTEVSQTLGVAICQEKGAEFLQYSRQMDGPFLLSLGGSIAAKIMGSLCGISVFDDALSNLKSDIFKLKKSIEFLGQQHSSYEAQIISYVNIPVLVESVSLLESSINSLREQDNKLRQLKSLRELILDLNDVLDKSIDYDKVSDILNVACTDLDLARSAVTQVNSLSTLLNDMADHNHTHKKAVQEGKALKTCLEEAKIELSTMLTNLQSCPVCGTVLK